MNFRKKRKKRNTMEHHLSDKSLKKAALFFMQNEASVSVFYLFYNLNKL